MFKNLLADVLDAWLGIQRRPFRFLLSGLGIGIGVSALIAMLSISEGAQRNALERIKSLGTNSIRIERLDIIQPGGTLHEVVNLSKGLISDDALTIKQHIPHGSVIGTYLKKEDINISSTTDESSTLIAVSVDWFAAEQVNLIAGRFLFPRDIIQQNRVCIIAAPLANKLKVDIGKSVRVEQDLYRIIGISAPKGRLLTEGTGLSAIDFDNILIIPNTAFSTAYTNKKRLDGIVVSLPDKQKNKIEGVAERIKTLLKKRHRDVNDFLVVAPLQLLREAQSTQRIFSLVMGAIAGLSLLVGGIGVMNVMLANINEQTKEIGLRIAVGATKTRIISLYLCQAVLLTVISGVWGVLGGMAIAQIVQIYAGWSVGYSVSGLMIGPTFAILFGVMFGIYPAFRAAATSPTTALRDS